VPAPPREWQWPGGSGTGRQRRSRRFEWCQFGRVAVCIRGVVAVCSLGCVAATRPLPVLVLLVFGCGNEMMLEYWRFFLKHGCKIELSVTDCRHSLCKLPLPLSLSGFVANDVSRSILPLPLSIWYHSNRADLLYPTVHFSSIHCHSSCPCMYFSHPTTITAKTTLWIFPFLKMYFTTTISLSILPLPHSIWYHSNRTDLLYPTVPLPSIHCHYLRHCMYFSQLTTILPQSSQKKSMIFSIFSTYFLIAISRSIPPLPLRIRYQNDRADLLYPTVPLTYNHCHSSLHCMFLFTTYHKLQKNLLSFSIFIFIFYNHHIYVNTATATSYLVSK
jgi:hypothetical protein